MDTTLDQSFDQQSQTFPSASVSRNNSGQSQLSANSLGLNWPVGVFEEFPELIVTHGHEFGVCDLCCGGAGGFAAATRRIGGKVSLYDAWVRQTL